MQLVEREEYVPELGGVIKYRELTGQERLDADEAAMSPPASEEHPDNDLWRATIISIGLLEPQLTPDDVFELQKARSKLAILLAGKILSLSEAAPGDMKSLDSEADDGQQDAGDGAAPPDDDAG